MRTNGVVSWLGCDDESERTFTAAVGKTITAVALGADDALHFEFSDGRKMKLYDDCLTCCEDRYMRTDDDLPYFVGAKLLGAEIKHGPVSFPGDDESLVLEVQFLEVKTSKGVFTMASHVEHNGYYGGFCIAVVPE